MVSQLVNIDGKPGSHDVVDLRESEFIVISIQAVRTDDWVCFIQLTHQYESRRILWLRLAPVLLWPLPLGFE